MPHYYDPLEADLALIQAKKVGLVGYGSQGHAHALNLRDSGVTVEVGLREGSKSRVKAEAAGFAVRSNAEIAKWADVIVFATPDQTTADIYAADIRPHLTAGKTLMFIHGFNIHFGLIIPPADVAVVMVAPKGPGYGLRMQFEKGTGLPALIRAGFETLVKAGYQPEIAYFECLHETKLIVDLLYQGGLTKMANSISDTAEWGGYVTGDRVVDDATRAEMGRVLADIQSGKFAQEWVAEARAKGPRLSRYRETIESETVEQVGKEMRARMPFLNSG